MLDKEKWTNVALRLIACLIIALLVTVNFSPEFSIAGEKNNDGLTLTKFDKLNPQQQEALITIILDNLTSHNTKMGKEKLANCASRIFGKIDGKPFTRGTLGMDVFYKLLKRQRDSNQSDTTRVDLELRKVYGLLAWGQCLDKKEALEMMRKSTPKSE